MKTKLLFVGVVLALAGCASSPPVYQMKGYKGPEAMDRNEVMSAAKQCIHARLKPNVEYLTAKTDSGKVMVPVNVHCEPY